MVATRKNQIIKFAKEILFFCFFVSFFIFGNYANYANGDVLENEWNIVINSGSEDYSFPVQWGNIYKTDLRIKWKDCSNELISSDWVEIDRTAGVKSHDNLFTPPLKSCIAEVVLSGNNGVKDFFWSTELKFREIPVEFCGDGICQAKEDAASCANDCMQSVKVEWQQLAMKSSWQNSKNISGGEGMQMVMDIDWNKHDSNILYLTTDTTKVWKSIDRGINWFPVMKDSRNLGGVSIVSDPKNKDVVFLAASMSIEGSKSYYDGIYRSIDGGENWVGPIDGEINFKKRHAGKLFIIDDSTFNGFQSLKVFVGTPKGLYVTTNGGVNWNLVALAGIDILAIDWGGPGSDYVYASTQKGLYKYTISQNNTELIAKEIPGNLFGVSVDKNNSSIIFVAAGTNGIWKSSNAGNSFERVWNNLYPDINYQRVVIDDNNSERIYASPQSIGGLYPLFTHDSGASWSSPSYVHYEEWIGEGYYYAMPIAVDPENSDIAISQSDGPIIKTYDGGNTWHYSGSGYTGARVKDINFINKNLSLFCLTDYGVLVSDNNTKSFENLNVPRISGEKSCGMIDSHGEKIIATIGTWGKQDILISYDFGVSWTDVYGAQHEFKFLKFNIDNKNIVYSDKWISSDGGQTWKIVPGDYQIMAMSPRNGNVVFGIKNGGSDSWSVGVSTDSGQNWTQLGENLEASSIEDIAVDPFDDEYHILVAAVDKMIYEYKESKWRHINTSRGLKADYSEGIYHVEFDPRQKNIVWAAQRSNLSHGLGVYVSDSNGFEWMYADSNFGKYQNIWNIDISPFDSRVYVTGAGLCTNNISLCDGKICDICVGQGCNGDMEVNDEVDIADIKITVFTDTNLGYRDEAVILTATPLFQHLDEAKKIMYDSILYGSKTLLSEDNKYSLATFVNTGTVSTVVLGAGERSAVLHSYKSSFGKLPTTDYEWEDIIKISNGRWPNERSETSEKSALEIFKKIYLRSPDTANQHDDSALKIIAYGLRPTDRNMDSEKFSINTYKNIFGHNPSSTLEWDTMRAIAYSGAKR